MSPVHVLYVFPYVVQAFVPRFEPVFTLTFIHVVHKITFIETAIIPIEMALAIVLVILPLALIDLRGISIEPELPLPTLDIIIIIAYILLIRFLSLHRHQPIVFVV